MGAKQGDKLVTSDENGSSTKGFFFHFYNRGLEGNRIFFTPRNFYHCLRLVKKYATAYSISVIAYCLMPNHYHILIRQDGNYLPSKLIQSAFNAYVQAINKEQGRKGTIFEGRAKHILVDREDYLIHLCRYIHLNPVQAGLVQNPEDWIYSNYLDWIGERSGTLLDEKFIHDHFHSHWDYRDFVVDYVEDQDLTAEVADYVLE